MPSPPAEPAVTTRAETIEAERSCIAQTNLRNLMVWHRHASDLPCEKVPVEAILEEFHKLSGARGRNAHRGQAPPQYNFTVKEEAGSSGV